MSKRVILSDFEIEQIVAGLKELQNQPSLAYQVTKCGRDFYQTIIDKLSPSQQNTKEDK